jgi:hypothetical protein
VAVVITRLALLTAKVEDPAYILSALAGIHPSQWSRYATGRELIRYTDANRIAAVFGIDRDVLMGRGEIDGEFLSLLATIRPHCWRDSWSTPATDATVV